MFKHLKIALLLGTIILLLTACAAPTAAPTLAPVDTSTPIIIVVTATPMPVEATFTTEASATLAPPTNTPLPKVTFTPIPPVAFNQEGTPVTGIDYIYISGIKDTISGQARITWNATGTFAKGFRIYYSPSSVNPYYGGGFTEYAISDGAARSAYIEGVPGTTYYYRICSYTGSGCDFYSNSVTFKFKAETP